MIIEVVGKEIEKIKGDFESYLNGLNMVGEISYSQYSELYDEGTKQIQKAYELGNKANEWHYVKDGDYPKDNKPVLCILGDIDSDSFEVGYYNDVGSGEPWHFESFLLPDDDGDNAWGVSAWKEIVLPELKESR